MIVTEEEAKTKRCQEGFGPGPMSQDGAVFAVAGYGGGGAVAMQTSPSQCIGSACMAWRWAGRHWTHPVTGQTLTNNPSKPSGYCGKAGKP